MPVANSKRTCRQYHGLLDDPSDDMDALRGTACQLGLAAKTTDDHIDPFMRVLDLYKKTPDMILIFDGDNCTTSHDI
ncbi:hypothetical protein JG687_00010705 [Phytophthora cactorum]|uniref:Uncharacterized protein n=1 Tax=Phytophthora cactorum TaxID=29920 RepID=A0A8T1U9A4_9STRA|nr:hypothetical protein GQ600_27540 [Phytophthora cactorum]KAG6956270.1 hypothetical protein JG687_00010705 [Phytophthora cactorum]